ncbi:MAG: GxxExxY protein [Opitutales bacterium]|nr:GxxExxY protein [Opitutales bacterium]
MSFLFKQECFDIIGACMELHRELGKGYSEAVYQQTLEIVFEEKGIPAEREVLLPIYFHGRKLEKIYKADFLVFGEIILELKAVSDLLPEHRAQLINYLKITKKKVGLLVNFAKPSLQFERLVYEESRVGV